MDPTIGADVPGQRKKSSRASFLLSNRKYFYNTFSKENARVIKVL